jgi:predicted GNAT family acetyltransferase
MADIEIVDAPEQSRYEARIDEQVAGFVEYRRHPEVIEYNHTEVLGEFEGQGIGGTLARGVLDAAKADGKVVIPNCPFIAGWIKRHPEYGEILPVAQRARLGLPTG